MEFATEGPMVLSGKGNKPKNVAISSAKKHENVKKIKEREAHEMATGWVLWAHLPHDTKWGIDSYIKIQSLKTIEEVIALYREIPDTMVKNCMLFLMREKIQPIWEDKKNKNGGCFSFKISNKNVPGIWKKLSYSMVGETLSTDKLFLNSVNGITISPKKSFCIIKLWMSNTRTQNPRKITPIPNLSLTGCIFKKHKPDY